jgi:hypothetical protein
MKSENAAAHAAHELAVVREGSTILALSVGTLDT